MEAAPAPTPVRDALRRALKTTSADRIPSDPSAAQAHFLPMRAADEPARAGSIYTADLDLDSHWHYHDMHHVLYAFQESIEVEVAGGRHVVPRQVAVWIPAGVAHRASFHRVQSVSVFFPQAMVAEPGSRLRTFLVLPLAREMFKESLRWPIYGEDSPLRTGFYGALAGFCNEWVRQSADLFLPTSQDPRLVRALNYTRDQADPKLADVCHLAGISERTLRRRLKQEIGMTWEAYRQRTRLLRAVALLDGTETPIADIADQCGFETPSSFTRAFRVMMGESPRDYRNRVSNLLRTS